MTLHAESDPVDPTTRSGREYPVPRMLCSDCEKPLITHSVWWDTAVKPVGEERPLIYLGKVHLILGCDNFLCSSETTVRWVVL